MRWCGVTRHNWSLFSPSPSLGVVGSNLVVAAVVVMMDDDLENVGWGLLQGLNMHKLGVN
jgi:hypothetical protein